MTKLMTAILPKEITPHQLAYVHAFLGGATFILLTAVSISLFVSQAGVELLPWAFIAAAFILPGATWAFNRFSKQSPQNLWLILTVFLLVVWAGTWLIGGRWVSLLLLAGYLGFLPQMMRAQSQATNRLIPDARERKDQTSTMLMWTLAGVFLFGLLIRPWMVVVGDPTHLLVIAALCSAAVFYNGVRALQIYPDLLLSPSASSLNAEKSDYTLLRGRPLVRSLFAYQLMAVVISHLILFLFLTYAARSFAQNLVTLPSFFAGFSALVQAAAGALLLFVFRPMMRRSGLNFGLITSPLAVLCTALLLLAMARIVPGSVTLILSVAMLLYGVVLTLNQAAAHPTIEMIAQILPLHERDRVIAALQNFSLPIGLAITGFLLIVLSGQPQATSIVLALIAILSVVWLAVGRYSFKQYGQTLQDRLNRRMLDEVALALDNAETISRVEGLIGTGNPPMIRLALNLLKNDAHPSYQSRLVGLLNYRNEIILSDVLDRIETERLTHLYPTLTKLFERHSSGRVKGRILRTISACNPDESGEFVQAHIDHEDRDVQLGSLVGLLKYGGLPGSVYAGMRLIEINENGDRESQLYTAKILEAVGASSFYQPILDQLSHPDACVRLAALRAASQVVNGRLVPAIIQNLGERETRSESVTALLAHKDFFVPLADGLLQDGSETPPRVKGRIARVLGQIGSGEAQEILLNYLSHTDRRVRSAVLDALRHSGYEPPSAADRERINQQMIAELQEVADLITMQRDIGTGGTMERLQEALTLEQEYSRNRLFNLLALLYDRRTIWTANQQLGRVADHDQTLADETLDVLLSDRHNQQIGVMIDPTLSNTDRLNRLGRWVEVAPPQTAVDQLQRLIDDEACRSWTRASAIYGAALSGFDSLAPNIQAAVEHGSPMVAETAEWALGQLSPNNINGGDCAKEKTMLTIEKVAILKAASIFRETPGNVLASVAAIVTEIPLEAHETFIRQGDASTEMYLIVEGEVEAVINGKPIIKLGAGQTVGELGIFNQEKRSADVRTLGPTLLFSIEREALDQLMADRPEIAQGIIGALSRRIREQGQLMSQSA